MKKIINIIVSCFLLNIAGVVHADDIAKWSLPETQKPDEEFLLYRLSYRGFFTAFIWKDLADAVIVADSNSYQFNKQSSCQLHLKFSTEKFLISELVRPMRYHWRTTASPDMSHVLLIEEVNKNDLDKHNVAWINQEKKQIEFYHKRKKIALRVNAEDVFYDDDSDEDAPELMVWERDGKKRVPDFLVDEARPARGLNYLVHGKTVMIKQKTAVFDPLLLIYSARWHDYSKLEKVDYTVTYKDTFRKYQAYYAGKETLNIGGKTVDAIRVEIRRKKDESRSVEGFMDMWLSDDERRIPLQYFVKVKLGTIKLVLNASNLENYRVPEKCFDRKSVPVDHL